MGHGDVELRTLIETVEASVLRWLVRPANSNAILASAASPETRLPMLRTALSLVAIVLITNLSGFALDGQTRPAADDGVLQSWLQNMAWHHRYSSDEMQQVTGLSGDQLSAKLKQFGISEDNRPQRPAGKMFVLPYPGGRRPRIGFLDGAVDPQRETKLSVFCPWDDHSYGVLDIPEAVWSNLGLTYLAHTHVDTVWTKQGISLPQQEWDVLADGSFVMERRLPNGIEFGVKVIPLKNQLRMKMWLTNGTDQPLTDLRVQHCVMLKAAEGFEQQDNDNKMFTNGYAIAHSPDRSRWMISGWDPVNRAWGNGPCPCLHSDPKFSDCQPGETKWLRGWFSFYEGKEIDSELERIEATGWRKHPLHHVTGNVVGEVQDADSKKIVACRLYVQSLDDQQWHFAKSTAIAGSAVELRKQIGNTASVEKHTTVSADSFQLHLKRGRYRVRAERGKEYIPAETEIVVPEGGERVSVNLKLKRFVDMAQRGWYSGDTHAHKSLSEMPNVVLAEDLNVAFPLGYWVRDSTEIPAATGSQLEAAPQYVDGTHVVYPVNTEYEIFSVDKQPHTQGAVLVLNHKTRLNIPAPPVLPVAEEVRRQGAILDLEKHSWNWSLMIVPLMNVDLFELSNNHHWKTQFGFPKWTLENAADWAEIERSEAGFTERGWTEFGLQTYYTLLNCGFRMRVSAGTGAGVHPVALGHSRVYVHCGDDFSYERWIERLNAGNSFVTQGPLLDVRFNGELPGTTWHNSDSRTTVRITGSIESLTPLMSIEVVINGETPITIDVQPSKNSNGVYSYQLNKSVELSGSNWIALRCFQDLPDEKISFAHTNPVYVDVADQPLRPRKSRVAFFVKRMDEEIARNAGVLSDECLAEYRQARNVYAELLKTARD